MSADKVPAAAELAVYAVAAAQGADAAALLDSRDLMRRITAEGPDTAGFVGRVTEMVREAVQTNAAYRLGGDQPAAPAAEQPTGTAQEAPGAPVSRNEALARQATRRAQLTPDYAGEITAEDLQLAEPSIVAAWATSGKLAHLGVPQQKARRWRG
ncbi:hypothetical protein ACWDBD_03785 [Streptomyces sp. NPDC001118]